jgi:phospholipid-translocating P-type ATPase (flippase)
LLFIKEISPYNPITQLIPVLLVLSVSVFRETLQELDRQREDRRLNLQKTRVNFEGEWVETNWKDVCVGDLVMVLVDQPSPADLVMIASSSAGNTAYIQTTNLDGETNFKSRCGIDKAASAIDMMTSTDRSGPMPEITVKAEPPRSDLDWFQGEISFQHFEDSSPKQQVETLSVRNFIPREGVVRGTDWIIGIVTYTGKDTKVLLGNQRPDYKTSKIDRMTDQLVMVILFLQFSIAIYMGVSGALATTTTPHWWLDDALSPSTFLRAIFDALSCVILITQMIPISLIISLEIAKVYQAKLMEGDVEIPATRAASQALNDDLGQIGYVLSDKTGTLTSNELVLKVATIEGKPYPDLSSVRLAGKTNHHVELFIEALAVCHDVSPTWTTVEAPSASARKSILSMKSDAKKHRSLKENSGATTPLDESGLSSARNVLPPGLSFCGSSPDEICLVTACAENLGLTLHKRTHSYLVFTHVEKGEISYKIVRFFEFDNLRRRSSIVILNECDDSVSVFVKGSDDAVLPRCLPSPATSETEASLQFYARQSLRTLVFGHKKMTKTDWDQMVAQYPVSKDLIEEVESGLTLLGCTGTEDRLQDGVQGSIQRMRTAGISVWMITGDKLDTAIEISKSANLIAPTMKVITFDIAEDLEGDFTCLHDLEVAVEVTQVAAVVTGRSIRHLVKTDRFINGLLKCKSVVVCRSTKDQKAQMVELVQHTVKGKVLVLAIGDGANDVPMIKKADVGIGIAGKEGRQAAQNADYIISQFSHLDRLLLFHGRLNYVRTSKMVLYFLFKNLVLCLPFVIHAAVVSLFSSSALMTSTMGLSFNAMLTALPVFALGLVERDVSPNDHLVSVDGIKGHELAQAYPRLYVTGRENRMFSRYLLGSMFVASVLCGCWIYLCSVGPLVSTAINADGYPGDHWGVSDVYFLCVFIVDTASVLIISDGVTTPMTLTIVYSTVGCITFLISNALDPSTLGGFSLWELITKTVLAFPIILIASLPPILTGIAGKGWKYRFDPTARMVWQEAKERADKRRAVLRKMDNSPKNVREKIQNQYKAVLNSGRSFFYRPDDADKEFKAPLISRNESSSLN